MTPHPPPAFQLAPGHVTLVVGAQRGIGFACARAFLDAGASVALADLHAEGLANAKAELVPDVAAMADVSVHVTDISRPEAATDLLADAVAAHGHVDTLVNAAGILNVCPAIDLEADAWDRVHAVNARGSFLLAQATARHLRHTGRPGQIILFGSIAATTVRPNTIAYCASKAAVRQLARCLAFELAPEQITVNVVSPGSTDTEMLVGGQAQHDPDLLQGVIDGDAARWRLGIPLGRLASPADQAAAALFLATPAARHITGGEIVVDGGQSVV